MQEVSSWRRGTKFLAESTWVQFAPATYEEVDFTRSRFEYFIAFGGARFVNCNFSDARFAPSSAMSAGGPVEYQSCRFDGAVMADVSLGEARFVACTFRETRLLRVISFCGQFVDCLFAGRVAETTFHGRPSGPCADALPRKAVNEFHGNDFRAADLYWVAFTNGIDLDAQVLPSDPAYIRVKDFHRRLRAARLEVAGWPAADRELALVQLQSLEWTYENQEDVFARRIEPRGPFPEEIQDRVWSVIERA